MMGCGLKKVGNLLAELDSRKGIGLITRIRQGLGRPDKIYVRKCTQQDMYKRNIQTRQNDISGNAKMTGTDMSEMPGNDTEDNKTEISDTDRSDTEYLSFYSEESEEMHRKELMIFPDTHEAIIDQDTWDIAQKLRVRAKPRAANGTYSHRLSGMIYCADCGSRMGFISPEARQSGKHYDSDSAFQCGNYRNQNNECVSHFIKTSALEAAILQAIKAVSQYVIENEAEFISQLKTVWNESKSKSANNGQQEIDEAKKRMAELDAKIQKLYDSAISGLLPERQAQRMIQQYDEEQLMLEKRVEELQGQIQEEEVEKIDTNRFIALVNKYRNCEELTDTMLYVAALTPDPGVVS